MRLWQYVTSQVLGGGACTPQVNFHPLNAALTVHVVDTLLLLPCSIPQVLWSFISGRSFMIASFMGRGVTSRAALSLSHIVQAISNVKQTEVRSLFPHTQVPRCSAIKLLLVISQAARTMY